MMNYKTRKGIYIPESMKVKSWIVTGTPGCGKTFLMDKIKGVPGEICVDISMKKWWKIPHLAQRPREVHFSLPFIGRKKSRPIYDDLWSKMTAKELPEVNLEKIRIPKKKSFFLAPDWRARVVFDFILPPPAWVFKMRKNRLKNGDEKLVDVGITEKLVEWQVKTLWKVARHLHWSGLHVLVRPFNLAYPYDFEEIEQALRQKPSDGGGSVFPDEVDMGLSLTLTEWIEIASPFRWRETPINGQIDLPPMLPLREGNRSPVLTPSQVPQ